MQVDHREVMEEQRDVQGAGEVMAPLPEVMKAHRLVREMLLDVVKERQDVMADLRAEQRHGTGAPLHGEPVVSAGGVPG